MGMHPAAMAGTMRLAAMRPDMAGTMHPAAMAQQRNTNIINKALPTHNFVISTKKPCKRIRDRLDFEERFKKSSKTIKRVLDFVKNIDLREYNDIQVAVSSGPVVWPATQANFPLVRNKSYLCFEKR